MAQNSTGHGIEDIYRGVISDVILQVREAFLDENVDVDVLQQLKTTWENKLKASGATAAANRPTNVAGPSAAPTTTNASVASAQIQKQSDNSNMNIMRQSDIQHSVGNGMTTQNIQNIQYLQNTGLMDPSQLLGNSGGIQFPPGFRVVSTVANANLAQYGALMQGMQAGSQNIVVIPTAGGQQVPMNLSALAAQTSGGQLIQAMRPTPQQLIAMKSEPNVRNIKQLDGAGGVLLDESEDAKISYSPVQASSSRAKELASTSKPESKPSKGKILQLDGGPGMTDSSSEDEMDEEEDPLHRYARLEDDKLDGDIVEEDPLNSDDDQSDDEDLETLFDAENVVVCQFEKVHRARSKWKFTLKDGIMHIDGKDYCFQKCSGEAEW
uniref:Uncharacterized protein n=1 Tax=Ditylenchus dipsaci TaxID=166011 RepID=A0A915D865_9BILA